MGTLRAAAVFEFVAIGALVFAAPAVAAPAAPDGAWIPFVLPWDDAVSSSTDVSFLLDAPAGKGGFVAARDGRFFAGDKRLRFWGTNICFGACFPDAAEAAAIAGRLAKFGVNCVRFHHMDMGAYPSGIFKDRTLEELSPEALERLDRFVYELKLRGIYTNINLHVSRWWSRAHGWPDTEKLESFDKMVDIVHPDLIAAQRKYARDLLLHENPHTKARYVDEPAVAIVEINNEDSLFMWSAPRELPALPEVYAKILAGRWHEWLRARYATDEALAAAWAKGATPLGETMIADPEFATLASERPRWTREQHEGSRVRLQTVPGRAAGATALRAEIEQTTGTSWHLKVDYPKLAVAKGAFYTLSFEARADRSKRIHADVSQDRAPWGNLGLSESVELGPAWRTFRFGFEAPAAETDARLCFSLGEDMTPCELAGVELRTGGRLGFGVGERLAGGNIALFPAAFSITEARLDDRLRFFHDAERSYFVGMRDYLKRELGVKSLITGTIAFGSLGTRVQAEFDFVDQHAYWQHPNFPRRPWDARDWTVENRAMSSDGRGGTFPHLAATRVAGKPYTVTEYNHPAPLDSQAETAPMIAAFAALQDWDGVFLFTYSHAKDYARSKLNGFFDIDANPAKMGFMPAGALLFLGDRLEPVAGSVVRSISFEEAIAAARRSVTNILPYLEATGFEWRSLLENRWALSFDGAKATATAVAPAARQKLVRWEGGERGRFVVDGAKAKILCGRLDGSPIELGGVRIDVRRPASATIMLVSRDGAPLAESRDILLVACGRCENTDMGWNERRDSVGDRWGSEPVRIEVVEATVAVRSASGERPVAVHALDERGKPAAAVPTAYVDGAHTFAVGGAAKSLWYAIER